MSSDKRRYLYNNFADLPVFDQEGNMADSLSGQAAISGLSEFISSSVLGTHGGTKSELLKFTFGAALEETVTLSLRFKYLADDLSQIEVLSSDGSVLGFIADNIISDIPNLIGEELLGRAIASAAIRLAGLAGITIGSTSLLGAVAVGVAGSVAYSLLEGFGEYLIAGFNGSAAVNMKFTDAFGIEQGGLYFPDGLASYDYAEHKEQIAYFIDNYAGAVAGGSILFSQFGIDAAYDLYAGDIYHTISSYLDMSLVDFLNLTNGSSSNGLGYIAGSSRDIVIFAEQQKISLLIPYVINGVKRFAEVNGVFLDTIHNDNIVIGRENISTIDNALIVTEGSDTPLIIKQALSSNHLLNDYIIIGTATHDQIIGGADNDIIMAKSGDDFIRGGYGINELDGGLGNDTIDYSFVEWGSRDITVNLSLHIAYNDFLVFKSINDSLYNIENVIGTSGDDDITGDGEDNILYGNSGADKLSGGDGSDILIGGTGNDELYGDKGADLIYTGWSYDIVTTGTDSDIIIIGDAVGSTDILDFDIALDRIDLTNYAISSFAELSWVLDGSDTILQLGKHDVIFRDIANLSSSNVILSGFSRVSYAEYLENQAYWDSKSIYIEYADGSRDYVRLALPVDKAAQVSSEYGRSYNIADSDYIHEGLDFVNTSNLYAAYSGVIDSIGYDAIEGRYVRLKHEILTSSTPLTFYTYYYNIDSLGINTSSNEIWAEGDEVASSAIIGRAGYNEELASNYSHFAIANYLGERENARLYLDHLSTGDFSQEINGGEPHSSISSNSNLSYDYVGDIRSNVILGNDRDNIINGHQGADIISGAGGNDWLIGGSGQDELSGGAGADILEGGSGDKLAGDAGQDIYRITWDDSDVNHQEVELSDIDGGSIELSGELLAEQFTLQADGTWRGTILGKELNVLLDGSDIIFKSGEINIFRIKDVSLFDLAANFGIKLDTEIIDDVLLNTNLSSLDYANFEEVFSSDNLALESRNALYQNLPFWHADVPSFSTLLSAMIQVSDYDQTLADYILALKSRSEVKAVGTKEIAGGYELALAFDIAEDFTSISDLLFDGLSTGDGLLRVADQSVELAYKLMGKVTLIIDVASGSVSVKEDADSTYYDVYYMADTIINGTGYLGIIETPVSGNIALNYGNRISFAATDPEGEDSSATTDLPDIDQALDLIAGGSSLAIDIALAESDHNIEANWDSNLAELSYDLPDALVSSAISPARIIAAISEVVERIQGWMQDFSSMADLAYLTEKSPILDSSVMGVLENITGNINWLEELILDGISPRLQEVVDGTEVFVQQIYPFNSLASLISAFNDDNSVLTITEEADALLLHFRIDRFDSTNFSPDFLEELAAILGKDINAILATQLEQNFSIGLLKAPAEGSMGVFIELSEAPLLSLSAGINSELTDIDTDQPLKFTTEDTALTSDVNLAISGIAGRYFLDDIADLSALLNVAYDAEASFALEYSGTVTVAGTEQEVISGSFSKEWSDIQHDDFTFDLSMIAAAGTNLLADVKDSLIYASDLVNNYVEQIKANIALFGGKFKDLIKLSDDWSGIISAIEGG